MRDHCGLVKGNDNAATVLCNVDYTQISSHPTAVCILHYTEKQEKTSMGMHI